MCQEKTWQIVTEPAYLTLEVSLIADTRQQILSGGGTGGNPVGNILYSI
jgi:hypothetical protein